MLPIRDNIPSASFPVATLAIIILNAVAFLHEVQIGPTRLEDLMVNYAIIPARYTQADVAHLFTFSQQIFAFFSSMFLHGGWLHLLGNMWTLWIFGDNVEDRLGRANYVLFYLGGGVAAGLLHVVTNAGSLVPTVGASGAIAAIMGGYFRLYPFAKVETLIPPLFFGPIFSLPAVLFLGWWFLLQFWNGAASLTGRGSGFGGIAWWAHIGGFIFGFAVCSFLRRRPPASQAAIFDVPRR